MQILIVDDEKNIGRSMELILKGEGFSVSSVENATRALELIYSKPPDLVFLDVLLPDEDGLSLLPKIKQVDPKTEVVMISGHANISMAVEATRLGAYDFLEKPLQKEKILILIQHLLEKQKLQKQYQDLKREMGDDYQLLGQSYAIKKVKDQIDKIAPTNSKVLILGESGTGKELVAWALHQQSERNTGPFVKMNCAAIPDELTESELFGYQKGAFTGAIETRDGKFLQADQGTLFLDEIADMSLRVQTKVLRVLQDGKFERIGGKETLSVNVRVIAATNKNLENLVQQGEFREDLYYRLNVLPIVLPSLRERIEDIPILLQHFVTKFCLENNRKPVEIEKPVIKVLQKYHWPGNIRELKNLVERLIILTPGEKIVVKNLPHLNFQSDPLANIFDPGDKTLKEVREEAERQYILTSLANCNGKISQAAKKLGIERTNLHKKMKALGITGNK
jgi:two-component system nitrogen regulation response regulator NtrX